MKYLRQFQVLATAFALALSFASSAARAVEAPTPQATAEKQKVVFQVSAGDPKIWNLALNNAKNVQQELGAKNVDLEIVVYGPGIGMLKFDSAVANRIDEAVGDGVKIVACEKTMTALKLTRDDMLASAAYVPAGVIELM
ncbi:MAG: DsrE family protein, partial [Sulfuricella sp.]|nr:DsrE family protein [Sulfuricella sp.]